MSDPALFRFLATLSTLPAYTLAHTNTVLHIKYQTIVSILFYTFVMAMFALCVTHSTFQISTQYGSLN